MSGENGGGGNIGVSPQGREAAAPKRRQYEHDGVVILRFDSEGRIVFSNALARETFGYGEEEFLHLRIHDIDPSIPEGAWPGHIEEVPPGGALKFTRRLRRRDGTAFPALVISHRPAAGGRHTILGFIHDISEEFRMQEELRRAQYFLDRTREQIIMSSLDGSILFVNDAACGSLGFAREELLRMNVCEINPTVTRETFPDKIRGGVDHQVGFFETMHKSRDGRLFPVEIAVTEAAFGGEMVYCAFARDISDRKREEEALRESEYILKRSQEAARLGSYELDLASGMSTFSDVLEDIAGTGSGYPKDIDGWARLVVPEQREEMLSESRKLFNGEASRFDREYRIIRPSDGQERWVHDVGELEYDEDGIPVRMIGMVRDITGQKRAEKEKQALEEQLRQAHKMESVGRLAGGVAHDFNNMLTIILGYAELMKRRVAPGDPLLHFLEEIEKAAGHSRDVTGQLLAFSRKQVIAPRAVNLNDLLNGMEKSILRLIGEEIRLLIRGGEGLWDVRFDPAQLSQILVNLALNGRDAMANGGKLTIATRNQRLEGKEFPDGCVLAPGDYVLLEVADTGSGMDQETLSHAFEPFFTTKEIGRGTGLGLSTVYGIVRQNDAGIEVLSESNRGTTVRIFIPRFDALLPPIAAQEDAAEGPPEEGSGTILLVEDETGVRGLAARMLEEMGYTVVTAGNPFEAISLLNDPDRPVDLLLTDVALPGMNGRVLSKKAEGASPGIGVLFLSGYSKELFVKSGLLEEGVHFLSKPFSRDALTRAVRAAMPPGRGGKAVP